jgi:O-antigen/teichoic acid export membrane protein
MSITVAERLKKNHLHILSEGIWIFGGRVISFISVLAIVRLLTTRMEIGEYGQLALILTISNLVTQLLMGPIGQGIGRYFMIAHHDGGYTNFATACKKILKYAGLLLGGVSIVIAFFSIMYGRLDYAYLSVSIFIFSYLTSINDIANGLQNLARNRMISARNSSIELVIRIPIVYASISIFGANVESVILAYICSSIFLIYVQKIDLKKISPRNILIENQKDIDWEGSMLKIIYPASFWGLFIWMQQASDKWALQLFSSISDVAKYTVIYQIGYSPVIMLIGILMTLFTPLLYRGEDIHPNLFSRLMIFVSILTLAGMVIAQLLGGFIMNLVASREYYELKSFLPLMILAAGLYSGGDLLAVRMMTQIRTMEILMIKIMASMFGLAINFLLAYLYGIEGVVLGLVFFGLIYLSLFSYAYKKSLIKKGFQNV